MAVLADAAPCGPVPGRTSKRQWTVPLPAVQPAAAAVSACPCRSRGCPPCRPPAGLRVSAGRVRCPSVRTVGVCRLRRPGPQPRPCPRNWTPRPCPLDVGIAARSWPDAAIRRGHSRGAPEQGRARGGRRRPTVHARPPATAVDANRPHAVSTAAAQSRRGRLSRPGCPPHGVPPQPADTAALSAVRPALRPPGDAVRTAGVHRGHRRRLRVSAATGSGRQTGGR
jgi:hypothetical protein